jgi:hypothetical protein
MKTTIFTTVFAFLSLYLVSQNKRFEDAMKINIALLDSAKKTEDFQKAANGFERITMAEKKEWLPPYYAAFCYVITAYSKQGDEIDTWCDKAEGFINKADSLSKKNSEVYVLKSMIASARISVNPMVRGQKFGMISGAFTEEALKLDPENPRAYLQKASGIFYTPEMFGGGAKKAKPVLETALEKFKTFKPKSTIHPAWGKPRAEELLKEASK